MAFELSYAKKRADTGEQFEFVDWLGEKIICARVDCSFDITDFVERGDHDDWDVSCIGIFFEMLADLEAAHFGHHDIEEDDVWCGFVDRVDGLEPVVCDPDIATEFIEVGVEEFEVLLVVVDNQHSMMFDR